MTAQPQIVPAASSAATVPDALRYAFQAHALGETQRAFETYQRILDEDPSQAAALVGMARVLEDNGHAHLAVGLRERASQSPTLDGLSALALARRHESDGQLDAALDLARRATALEPENAEAHFLFGHLSFAKGEIYDAHRGHAAAARLSPQNIGYLDALAQQSLSEHFFAPAGISAIRAAMAQGGETAERQTLLGKLLFRNRDYREAASVLRRVAHQPGLAPEDLVLLASAMRATDSIAEIRGVSEILSAHRKAVVEDTDQWQRVGGCLVRTHLMAGDAAEAEAVLGELRGRLPLRYDLGPYLPNTPQRLERLRALVRGRDVAILAHGPSIAGLEERVELLARQDVCLFGLNRFRLTEAHLLQPLGRGLDLAAVTPPQLMKESAGDIEAFLTRPTANLLVTLRSTLDALPGGAESRAQLEAQHDERLLYVDSRHAGTATPSYPLHFIPANSMTVLLGIALLGAARRIFVFGADGAAQNDAPATSHYKKDAPEFVFRLPDGFDAHYPAAILADTERFNEVWEANLAALSILHDLPRPPIYNVNPDSAVAIEPKVSYDEAFALIAQS